MKYKIGETVLLLDTEFKPACSAVIRACNIGSHQYEVDYQYPGSNKTEKIRVPQERLASSTDIINNLTGNIEE